MKALECLLNSLGDFDNSLNNRPVKHRYYFRKTFPEFLEWNFRIFKGMKSCPKNGTAESEYYLLNHSLEASRGILEKIRKIAIKDKDQYHTLFETINKHAQEHNQKEYLENIIPDFLRTLIYNDCDNEY